MNGPIPKLTIGVYLALLPALALAWTLYGALPGIAVPTLGQAVWASGFSLSFADSFPPSLFAVHFGAPEPASIAFGLAGAYPAALFIAAGMHPADAYSAMTAFWITVAFLSAWRIALRLQLGPYLAILAALLWISMPVGWRHTGFSMVSTGIALLPFYFLAVVRLVFPFDREIRGRIGIAAFYLAACFVAVFMDGYTFMMFAVGAGLFLLGAFIAMPECRRYLLLFGAPLHAGAFILAYLAYVAYIGKPQFEPASIPFFRGWGADVTFFLWPSRGVLWIWDMLGLSEARTSARYFGDASVWITTFILPVAVVGVAAWFVTRSKGWVATAILLIAVFGLYMSLGPSLKFASVRPPDMPMDQALMPGNLAIGSTGSAILSKNVPGFRNMRASYRWVALAFFGFWMLTVLLMAHLAKGRRPFFVILLAGLLIVGNLPHPLRYWRETTMNRAGFMAIDRDLVTDMRQTLRPGEMVAFLPYGNDFFVNYLAPSVGVRSYNIGGDKNLSLARREWPPVMRRFPPGELDADFARRVLLLLARREADVVVLPYIDLLWAAHSWPSPPVFRERMGSILDELASTGLLTVDKRDHYAVVRLVPAFAAAADQQALNDGIRRLRWNAPDSLGTDSFNAQTPHQVGELTAGTLRTTGQTGFLYHGPNLPAEAGTYRLTVEGTLETPAGAWIDVTSSKGTINHGSFPLAGRGPADGLILDETVHLAAPTTDVEIRLWVSDRTNLTATGYRFEKVD